MNDQNLIHQLLDTYEHSLNTSDAALAASLYTSDAVFMPTTLPTATGADIRHAYEQIFDVIGLHVAFTVDELVVTGDVAYALTRSNGTQLNRATDEATDEANREIFILHRIDGEWKIARYMFNKADG
jgi:uncharacterized protein (TIGR02246 family)